MITSNSARLVLFPVLLAVGVATAARAPQDTSVKIHPVAGAVHYLSGGGGNVGVMLGDDGVLMVDDLFERNAKAIEGALAELGGDKPVWLVNTHWHGDHTGGNAHFGATARIVAHDNVRRRLAGDTSLGGRVADAPVAGSLPTVTYDGELSLHVNGEDVRLIHLGPAHTDGDSVVWFQGSNVVHMGDLFFNLGYPFIDLDSGGNVEGVIEACRSVMDLVPEDARIIPGHGEATDLAGLEAYVQMIETSLARVRAAHAEGKGAEQILADGTFDDLNPRWGSFAFVPPQRWVETLLAYIQR